MGLPPLIFREALNLCMGRTSTTLNLKEHFKKLLLNRIFKRQNKVNYIFQVNATAKIRSSLVAACQDLVAGKGFE